MTAASSVHATEQLLFFTLLQLVVIILAARLGGLIAKRCGQAVAVGEIVTGILLGPSLFGALAPETFAWVFKSTPPQPLNILSQIGLLLLMFQIGLEFDFAHLREKRNRRAVMAVSAAGLILPFALGLALALALPQALVPTPNRLGFSLFVATAFSITALPILGRIMMEFDLTRTPLGVIAISAAAINDVVGWLLLALVTALSTSGLDGLGFAGRVIAVLVFAALCWFGVRPWLIRFVRSQMPMNNASSEATATLSPNLMGVLIATIFVAGMCTFALGIFAIFGGFLMGVLLHTEQAFVKAWNDKIGTFVNVFFLPIFFTYTGLRTDIGSLSGGSTWGWCVLLITLATLGKFGGCWLAARWAGLDGISARLIGVMMNTRALMELIIINVGFELGLIGKEVFTMLVLMAIFSTVITTPFLRRWLPLLSVSPPQHQPKSPLLQADAG
jgi:Kef-type K+ transport system membrane component KefB